MVAIHEDKDIRISKAMKIFNKMVYDTFQGYADQGQVFEDDKWYSLTPVWKYRSGEVSEFVLSGVHIYEALNGNRLNSRFCYTPDKTIPDFHSKEFETYIVENLILNHLRY